MRAVVLVALAACADPVVDMQLDPPPSSSTMSTSCVQSVEVHVNGPNYPHDPLDIKQLCIPLDRVSNNYSDLIADIRGKFALGMPDGGLAGVEVYGWAGQCDRTAIAPFTPDLIFFSSQKYVGQDLVELEITPNLDCSQSQAKLHLFDIMTLVSGANPSDANCTAAAVPDAPGTGAGLVTMMPKLFDTGVAIYGGLNGAESHNSVAQFPGLTTIGPKSCLGWQGGSNNGGGAACVSTTSSVCAGAGEIESPFVADSIATGSMLGDANRNRFPGAILGSVWTGTGPKHPAAGATIDIDPAQGVVEYVDPPDAGSPALKPRTGNGTGTSGLFLLFTNTLADVKVNYNGKTTAVKMSAIDNAPGGALIVVN